jgi:glutaredoxin
MIEVYSKDNCVYCTQAVKLLNSLMLPFNEQKLGIHFTREFLLEKFPGAKTFPVVVVDGMYIGGYNELHEEMKRKTADARIFLTE